MIEAEGPRQPADQAPVVRLAKLGVILLMLLAGVVGGVLGWTLQDPIYRSEGLVFVQPRLESPEDPCGPGQLPMFQGFMAYQVQLLQTRRTIQRALETEIWKATGEGADAVVALRFESRLSIAHEPGAQVIVVRFEDLTPEVALAGVRALLEAYESLIAAENEADERLEYVKSQREVKAAQIKEIQEKIIELTREFGGVEALEVAHQAAVEALIAAEQAGASEQEVARLRERARRLGETRVQVERLQAEREDLVRQLEQMERMADQLECQLVGSGHITAKDRGALPTEPFRRTPCWPPAAGAAAGALLGLLLGLAHGRRRA